MIDPDKRKAIFLLHQEGMAAGEISRRLKLDYKTVLVIIQQQGVMPHSTRSDKQVLDEALLRRLYQECSGWMARMHEKLVEEEGVKVSYSTLTRRLRELGMSTPQNERCDRVPDEPGLEMQHDTSPYQIELSGRGVKLIASMIYLRYSKRRYLRFYRAFDRFKMKSFLHQALMYWGYSARQCIIDNTNLARLRGTGANALITPEMEAFARQYAFTFRCHELKHANRKAGNERNFWTLETNFLPGRTFTSLEDLNVQARAWSTERMDHKPQGPVSAIPAKTFEHECAFLTPLLPHLPAPYRDHSRGTDQYGFAPFGANHYWVPGLKCEDVKILEYADCLKICQAGQCLIEYPLPADGVKNEQFHPEGQPPPPGHRAKNCKQPTQAEEKHLRGLAPAVNAYLDFALPIKGIQKHQFIRRLMVLSRRISVELLCQSLERARKYQITSLETVERIVWLYLQPGAAELPLLQVDEALQQREAYQEGAFTDPPDLSIYQDPPPTTPPTTPPTPPPNPL
jgi:transposase